MKMTYWHLYRQFLSKAQQTGKFRVELSQDKAPPASTTCDIHAPVHLRYEYPLGTQSIGHLIRDNLQVCKVAHTATSIF